ncbi:MAG: hypothetical protein IT204_17790 [Fimbriimonadaceae bacterium]|nr:hypothetical protein [Fimbriimonadaceae bacterium]
MELKPCLPYTARPAGTGVWRDGRSHFKIYYVDITGREHPERYEWALAAAGPACLTAALTAAGTVGIGFVVAFPHIAKVFRWSPAAETILLVSAFRPADRTALPLDRGAGEVEFACYAEALIAAGEYHLWAAASSVADYLEQWVEWSEAPVVSHTKLAAYWPA